MVSTQEEACEEIIKYKKQQPRWCYNWSLDHLIYEENLKEKGLPTLEKKKEET